MASTRRLRLRSTYMEGPTIPPFQTEAVQPPSGPSRLPYPKGVARVVEVMAGGGGAYVFAGDIDGPFQGWQPTKLFGSATRIHASCPVDVVGYVTHLYYEDASGVPLGSGVLNVPHHVRPGDTFNINVEVSYT